MEPLFGSLFFEFVGAFSKWIYYSIVNTILDRDKVRFKEIYNGRKGLKSADKMKNGMSNIAVGIVVTVVICMLLIRLGF